MVRNMVEEEIMQESGMQVVSVEQVELLLLALIQSQEAVGTMEVEEGMQSVEHMVAVQIISEGMGAALVEQVQTLLLAPTQSQEVEEGTMELCRTELT